MISHRQRKQLIQSSFSSLGDLETKPVFLLPGPW